MTKSGKFIKFLDTLKTSENVKLLESVKQGFRAVVESDDEESDAADNYRTGEMIRARNSDYKKKIQEQYNRTKSEYDSLRQEVSGKTGASYMHTMGWEPHNSPAVQRFNSLAVSLDALEKKLNRLKHVEVLESVKQGVRSVVENIIDGESDDYDYTEQDTTEVDPDQMLNDDDKRQDAESEQEPDVRDVYSEVLSLLRDKARKMSDDKVSELNELFKEFFNNPFKLG